MAAQSKNPFTLKVGQVITGFGAGCGIGVGVGYPIALGSIPVLGEMMSATSSAGSRAFGGVGHTALGMLGKLGIKNLKAGVGCGIGVGHGFGAGIALKPGVSQQIVLAVQERLSAATSQLQKHLPRAEGETQAGTEDVPPESQQEDTATVTFTGDKAAQYADKAAGYALGDPSPEAAAITSSRGTGEVEDLRQENEILRTLLRHQELIEDLKGQNASILQCLSEQFDVQIGGQEVGPADKSLLGTQSRRSVGKEATLHSFHSQSQNPHRKCFDCRISARRRR